MVSDIHQHLTTFSGKYSSYAPRLVFADGWEKPYRQRILAQPASELPKQLPDLSESSKQLPSSTPAITADTAIKSPDSAHFAFPREKRRAIVAHYRIDHRKGLSIRREDWARQKYGITWRTLKAYLREFPEVDVPSSA